MKFKFLFNLVFLTNLLVAQERPISNPRAPFSSGSNVEVKDFVKYLNHLNEQEEICSKEFECEIDFSVNQENNKNYNKVKFQSLDSMITFLNKKFTGLINIPVLDAFVSYKDGILHGKWKHKAMMSGQFINGQFNSGNTHGEWHFFDAIEGLDLIKYVYNDGKLIEWSFSSEGIDQQLLILGEDEIYVDMIQIHSTKTSYKDSDTIVETLSNTGYEPIWNQFKSIYELRKNDKLTEKKEIKYHVNGNKLSEIHFVYGDKTLKTEKYWSMRGQLIKENKYENDMLIKK